MAKLYIAEFSGLAGAQGPLPAPLVQLPPLAEQTVTIGSETDSAAFGGGTKLIRVHTDAICSIAVGSGNPAATTSNMRLPADHTEYFAVSPGDKLSVISNT